MLSIERVRLVIEIPWRHLTVRWPLNFDRVQHGSEITIFMSITVEDEWCHFVFTGSEWIRSAKGLGSLWDEKTGRQVLDWLNEYLTAGTDPSSLLLF